MAKELVLDVIAKKNSRELSTLADEFERLAGQTDDFGKKMHEGGTFAQYLDDQIAQTKVRVRELGDEFNRTGSKDVFANLRGNQSNLKSLEKIKADLSKALDDGSSQGGAVGGESFLASFSSAFEGGIGSVLMPVLIGTLVAVAPGAILAGLGITGIAAGIVGQLQNPAIRSAASSTGHDIMSALAADTAPFEQPIEAALSDLDAAAKNALGQIDFGALAADVEPFVQSLGDLVSEVMPGFNAALQAAGPVLAEFERDMSGAGGLGSALSEMFQMIADSGPGAVEAIRLLMMILEGLVLAVGATVDGVAHLVNWLETGLEWLTAWQARITTIIPGLHQLAEAEQRVAAYLKDGAGAAGTWHDGVAAIGAVAASAGVDLNKLSQQLNQTEVTADSLAADMTNKLFTAIMGQDQAVLGWHKALLDLHDTLDQNGRSIDKHTGLVSMNTQAGIANREAVLAAMTANMQEYQAFVAAGGAADQATKRYDDNTAALEKQLKSAGYNKRQIDDMIGSLKSVPDKVNSDIAVNGLTNAINNLGNLLAELDGLNGADYGFTITEKHVYESDYLTHSQGEQGLPGKAAGGPVTAGTAYLVGEQGPELFVASSSGYIMPNRLLNRSGYATPTGFGTGGAGGTTVNLTVQAGLGVNGYDLGRQVAEVLRPYVKGRGGDVQVALGA